MVLRYENYQTETICCANSTIGVVDVGLQIDLALYNTKTRAIGRFTHRKTGVKFLLKGF